MNKFEYKNLTPFKWFVLENFPFIEADFDALTEWQLFCKLGKEMNKIINSENTLGTQMETITNAFIELQNYVNNYFENLDVQDEINNKLNEMAENGTLENIISNFLNFKPTFNFNNVNELLNSTFLKSGSTAKTLGFYEIGDGGESEYNIVNDENLTVDNASVLQLKNGLKAVLIIKNNTINIKQIGARPQDKENNKYDIKEYVLKYLNILEKYSTLVKLYIPAGIWYTSPLNIARKNGFYIYGDKAFNINFKNNTVITSLQDNQDYVIKIGNNQLITYQWTFENITISSSDYIYNSTTNDFSVDSTKNINDTALQLLYATFGLSNNLFFSFIKGQALKITSSWENYFSLLNFRAIYAPNKGIFILGTVDTTLSESANITANTFEKIMFEAIIGDCIIAERNNKMGVCTFNNIEFEDYPMNEFNIFYTRITTETLIPSDIFHNAIISVLGDFNAVISNININNISSFIAQTDSHNYIFDTIFKASRNNCSIVSAISNINILGMNTKTNIIKQDEFTMWNNSQLLFDNIINQSTQELLFNVKSGRYIKCNTSIKPLKSKNDFELDNLGGVDSFKDVAPRYNSSTSYGLLYFDENAVNPFKLCVRAYSGESGTATTYIKPFANFVKHGTLLTFWAKLSQGETANIYLATTIDNFVTHQITGTGQFSRYDIDISKLTNGRTMIMRLNEPNKEVFFDYYVMS